MGWAANSTAREIGRLAALHRLEILDTPPEQDFDDVVALARQLTGCPIAVVSLVDARRQWFKARAGFDFRETPREVAFCDHVVDAGDLLVIADAAADPRFSDNPLVTGAAAVRFYAGAPIRTADGHVLGTVSVFDTQPRTNFDYADGLAALARTAAALMSCRRVSEHGARARAALARDLDRLWTLAHDLLIVCDLDGGVLAANPAWEAVFGPPQDGAATYMRDLLVDPNTRPDVRRIVDGGALSVTLDCRGVTGVRTITWTLRREGALVYAIGRDDTALRAAERDLVQAQRMESLGQLTGGIAHDFNNLLTIIIGNLDIATRRLERGDLPRVGRALADANDGAARAAAVTQRLLAFARRQRLAPRAIAPAALLADMRALLEHAVGEAAAVDLVIGDAVWAVEADPGQLEAALLNLAMNARDAMAGGGDAARLVVGAANATLSAAEASRHGVAPGDYVRFTVADTGSGMTADVLARALEPFFTTKGVGRGTGLGLSQVHGFARQSGGLVLIDSTPGAGTAVHLWLPRSAADPGMAGAQPIIAAPAPVPADISRGALVMVVEDNDALRELVVLTLRDAGYRVIEAHDGRAALSLFARQATPPDLLLSDIMMPGLDGCALAAEVRARTPATRVLLMSGFVGPHAAALPADAPLLVKPFTGAALLARVAAAMEITLPATA